MSKNNRQIFYAVGIGRKPGVYRSWDECKKELVGVVNPIYKTFCSLIEAKEFVKEWSNKTPKSISNNTQILKISKELNSMETSNISQHCNTTQKTVDNNISLKGDNIILGNHDLSNNSHKFPICTNQKTKRSHSMPCEKLNFKNEEYLDLECKGSTSYSPVDLVESVHFSNYKSFCISRQDRKQLDNRIFQMSYNELIDALKKRSSLKDGKSSSSCEKVDFNVEFNENSEIVKREFSDVPTPTNNTFTTSPVESSVKNEQFFKMSNIDISSTVLEDKNVDEISSFKLEPNIPECTDFEIVDKEGNPIEQVFSSEANVFETFAYDTNLKRNEPEFDHDLNYPTTQPVKNSLNNLHYIHDFRVNLKNFLLLLNKNFDNNSVTKTMVTTVAEQIINFISDSLKHITAGIVAAVNDEVHTSESNESVTEKNDDHILPMRDMLNISNLCPCTTDVERDMKNINEKLNNCEKKIDKCLNQMNMIASGFIEIKNEFKNLFQTMCKNSVSVPKVYEKFQPSVQKANYSVSSQNFLNKPNEIQTFSSKSNNKNKFELSELEDTDTNEETRTKKLKRSSSHIDKEPNTFIPYDSRLNDEQVKKEKLEYVGFIIDKDDYVVVYTDGACHSNGKESARAGIGIWFGDGHPLNVSKPISGVPTNNNAEIQAARIAIEMALSAGISKLKICTDSEFLINCATAWMKRWKTNNWMTKSKTQVKNRKELEKLDRVMSMLSVRWEKVAGHAGIRGNEMADQLANNGAHL